VCGIAGIVGKVPGLELAIRIRAMTDAVAHRGPDGEGHYVDGPLALGHRRLAILDLSDDGRQPMHAGDGQLVIVFNGEIYNYIELASELARLGYRFRSRTDTEVILAAYAQWGPACVSRFNGMWAFAIHDRTNRRLFCSRDRFGVKPFYYADTPSAFAFGSEIRELLPWLSRKAANRRTLADFITTATADHTDETFYEGVAKLPAGHNLDYDLETNRFSITRFYELQPRPDVAALSREQAVEAYREVLTDAVRLRLRSDVLVGTCLSGGLDSSSVATIAAGLYTPLAGRAFSAITAVSEQEEKNEAGYAQVVAAHGGMTWLPVRPEYRDFVDSLPQVVHAQEEPFASPSLTMQYFVMKTARTHGITVLLDGQGGDETLLGYERYYAAYLARTLRREGIVAFVRALLDTRSNNANMGIGNIAKYLVAGRSAAARYAVYRRRHRYLRELPSMPAHIRRYATSCWDDFALQSLEIRSTNLPLLLRYEDRNSMAHAIEARLPFLDYRAVETALSLPGAFKMHEGWSKWVLRKAMAGRMPDAIVWRRNKLAFEAPEDLWLARHREIMRETVFASPLLAAVCDPVALRAAYGGLDARSRWRLYSVALWEQAFGVAS
jgi:asparagine synthase (glutamine-hydrolysing)